MINLTKEKLTEVLNHLGYYIGCVGCDTDKENNVKDFKECKQEDMITAIVHEVNKKPVCNCKTDESCIVCDPLG